MDVFAVDPTRDLPRDRVIEVPDGAAFVITQHDPHGFWRIHREHGQVPESLNGEYTDVKYAQQAIQSYLTTPKKKTKE